MSGVLAAVDQRTQLVGENRVELLMFSLGARNLFGINVFKVQEVLKLPDVTVVPHSNYNVCGVVHLRGRTIPVINLSQAIGMGHTPVNDDSTIIVTEYNGTVQAFLVGAIHRIVNLSWDKIQKPPSGVGRSHYLTALTYDGDRIVEIIDVEKVLSEVAPLSTLVSPEILAEFDSMSVADKFIVTVDDSHVARDQLNSVISNLNINYRNFFNGQEALDQLKEWATNDPEKIRKILMIITDAEMPVMDGYRLTTEIRSDPRLKHLQVVMSTSLSGSFNQALAEKVGCDTLLSKFQPDDMARTIIKYSQIN